MKLKGSLKEMVEKGCPRDSYRYNALAKCGKIDEALPLFKRKVVITDQTVYTYTILISGIFRKHRNKEALKMWDGLDAGMVAVLCLHKVSFTL